MALPLLSILSVSLALIVTTHGFFGLARWSEHNRSRLADWNCACVVTVWNCLWTFAIVCRPHALNGPLRSDAMSLEQKSADPSTTASFGGYDYTFVVPLPEEYTCSICAKVENRYTVVRKLPKSLGESVLFVSDTLFILLQKPAF